MRRIIGVLLAASIVACGGDKATGLSAVAGNYTLRTVNGANVPAVVIQTATERDELTGGNVDLAANGTWTGSLTARATIIATGASLSLPIGANGTYTVNGSSITLTDASDGSQLTGTVSGETLTVSGDIGIGAIVTLVFKQ